MNREDKIFLINSIYRATEGEGVFIGKAQVFVRFQGCNVGCLNCDSKETWEFNPSQMKKISLLNIWNKIYTESYEGKIKNISITGGDPLHPKHEMRVLELSSFLKEKGFYLNIEAAGTRIVESIFNIVDYINFDLKTPSTGVKCDINHIIEMEKNYKDKFQIKAVIEKKSDFEFVLNTYQKVLSQLSEIKASWILTPSYQKNEEFPMERFIEVQSLNEKTGGIFRVIGQQHKWIYGSDKINV